MSRSATHVNLRLSSTAKKVQELKGKLVVGLYLGRRDFWKSVEAARFTQRV